MAEPLKFPEDRVAPKYQRYELGNGQVIRIEEESPRIKNIKGAIGGLFAGTLAAYTPAIFQAVTTLRPDTEGYVIGTGLAAAAGVGAYCMGQAGGWNSKRAMLIGAFTSAAATAAVLYTQFVPAAEQLSHTLAR